MISKNNIFCKAFKKINIKNRRTNLHF